MDTVEDLIEQAYLDGLEDGAIAGYVRGWDDGLDWAGV